VATVFFLATLGLAFMSNSVSRAQPADTGSVLEKAAPAVPQIPTAAQVPASGASN
jgi:preprotein translocase subunit SecG